MSTRVSVIVPVYNRERLILRCLESILRQSLSPYEIIVVDNNSTDNTKKAVESWFYENIASKRGGGDKTSFGPVKFKLLNQPIKGASAARQMGLENAEGDYVIFFDSDDEMRPELLKTALGKLQEVPDADIICWQCCLHLLDGTERIPAFLPANPLESHLIHTLLRPQGYMVRTQFILNVGGWGKNILVWNDLELGLRLLLNNPKIIALRDVLADIYSQEESITGKDFSSKEGQWEVTIDEMGKANEVRGGIDKDRIRRILDYRRVILAAHYYRENNKEGSKSLYKKTMKGKPFKEKVTLSFSYHFTRLGLRGAWRIARFFI